MRKKKQNRELFNDGIATVCKTKQRSITEETGVIRFGLRTVGISRFYNAKIASINVDNLISVPINNMIDTRSLLLINGEQYEVKQVQKKYDTVPPSMYLTLSKPVPLYADERSVKSES